MKMPFNQLYLSLLALAVLWSCSEELPEDQVVPTAPDIQQGYNVSEEFFVDEKAAIQIAENLNLEDPYNVEKPNEIKRSISQLLTVPSEGVPSYYILNYEKAGFAIISADKRNVPLLAYSDSSIVTTGKVAGGVMSQFEEFHDYTLHLRDSLKHIPEDIQEMWMGFLEPEQYRNLRKANNQRLVYAYTKGPYLPVDWGQGCTYNGLLSSCTVGGSCNRVFTGCVATATAQLMRYHRRPNSYVWAAMPRTNRGDDGVSDLDRLMRDIGRNISMNYGCDGSGAWPQDAANALRRNFGYASANYRSSFDWKEYRSELQQAYPVMLAGYSEKECFLWWCSYSGGHAWVGEGYYYRGYSSGNEYRYAYMNWGWDRDCNGWFYLPGNWNGFKYNKSMVTDIRP